MSLCPKVLEIKQMTPEAKIDLFENLLRYTNRQGIENVIEFIKTGTDFYTAPASTKYHSNYSGGLLDHSLFVCSLALRNMKTMVDANPELISKMKVESVILCSLLHDICKIGMYKLEVKKVKDDAAGKWLDKLVYVVDDSFPCGHGEKSVIILINNGLDLNADEILAIRFHMGSWDSMEGTLRLSMATAVNTYPLVPLLQISDFTASTCMEETKKI